MLVESSAEVNFKPAIVVCSSLQQSVAVVGNGM